MSMSDPLIVKDNGSTYVKGEKYGPRYKLHENKTGRITAEEIAELMAIICRYVPANERYSKKIAGILVEPDGVSISRDAEAGRITTKYYGVGA